MDKILVTGGMGFIGANFVRYIIDRYPGCDIVVYDKLTYASNIHNLIDLKERFTFVKGDICSKKVENYMRDCDAIVNFAAETHVDRSIVNPLKFLKTNFFGTYRLLEIAKKTKINRFVQISTDEIYGSIEKGSFSEEAMLAPSNPYSASKASADLLALSYFVTYDMPVLITRSTNNFGPYQHPEKLIPKLIINALRNKPLPIYGDGLNVRDWLYVLDNCSAIDLVLHKGRIGEIYNVAAKNERTNLEVAKLILKLLGKDEKLINFVRDRPGHDRRYSLVCKKIRSLGWKPKHKFEAALLKTVNWYAQNKWWWQKKISSSQTL